MMAPGTQPSPTLFIVVFFHKYISSITLPTDVISGTEEDWPESENKFAEEARFRILENLHSLQGVQVDMDGNLGFQFIRQAAH